MSDPKDPPVSALTVDELAMLYMAQQSYAREAARLAEKLGAHLQQATKPAEKP